VAALRAWLDAAGITEGRGGPDQNHGRDRPMPEAFVGRAGAGLH